MWFKQTPTQIPHMCKRNYIHYLGGLLLIIRFNIGVKQGYTNITLLFVPTEVASILCMLYMQYVAVT